ncbi:MAG: DUF4296 domain-containing protein [Bacteroidetes bacterium]|nr:DUF4296 domain-containing protein [Bacteroidota bacterium]
MSPRVRHWFAGSAVIAGIIASGCSGFGGSEQGMSDSTFVEVLVDLHLAQARLDQGLQTDSTLRSTVLQKHKVSEERLDAKVQSLIDDRERYLDLYGKVIDRLSEEQEGIR